MAEKRCTSIIISTPYDVGFQLRGHSLQTLRHHRGSASGAPWDSHSTDPSFIPRY